MTSIQTLLFFLLCAVHSAPFTFAEEEAPSSFAFNKKSSTALEGKPPSSALNSAPTTFAADEAPSSFKSNKKSSNALEGKPPSSALNSAPKTFAAEEAPSSFKSNKTSSTALEGKQNPTSFVSKDTASTNAQLFTPSNFNVQGPNVFPKPSDAAGIRDVVPILKPTFGKHRSHVDAVFVFAAEYKFPTYLTFVTSLRKTGFAGDIVFAISTLDLKSYGVQDFLRNEEGVVTYAVELSCFNAEWEETDSAKGGMRVCQLHNLWGRKETFEIAPIPDPRQARTIATTRYELYWIWSLQYIPHAWIMLLDARDSYFQANPFATLPRETRANANREDGLLYFFGENMDATRIGLSLKNRKWLEHAYGETVVSALENKPTICSGSTMGEMVALEAYLRAMVAEADETGTKLMGADQGFHNYLYYSGKLSKSKNIRSITVFDQGWGIINNLGAMRTKPLDQWGNGKITTKSEEDGNLTVWNWDGQISPVVHQFDRHKELSNFVYKTVTDRFKLEYFEDINQRVRARVELSVEA